MITYITKRYIKSIQVVLVLITLSSCASRKDLVYFQDEPLNDQMILDTKFELKYQTNDILTIDISALDPELAKPFNLTAVSNNGGNLNAQANLIRQTYLVDNDGNIEFPVLGTFAIGGMTRAQATAKLKEVLADYIKSPIVNIRLINFTVTVLGEVNKPGTYTVQDERISLPEALGLAGDLTIYGQRTNVFLIREVDGKKRFAKLDLTSINVVGSPLYYLAQNDVLVIEMNNAKVRQSSYNQNSGVIIAAISTLVTIAAILIR
jgi:polysaccharide export outer membrane protein